MAARQVFVIQLARNAREVVGTSAFVAGSMGPLGRALEPFGPVSPTEATAGQTLPLTEAQFKEALSAENMVFNRHGLGGPQLTEIQRMLSEHRAKLGTDTAWTKTQRESIAASTAALEKAFLQLMTKAGN